VAATNRIYAREVERGGFGPSSISASRSSVVEVLELRNRREIRAALIVDSIESTTRARVSLSQGGEMRWRATRGLATLREIRQRDERVLLARAARRMTKRTRGAAPEISREPRKPRVLRSAHLPPASMVRPERQNDAARSLASRERTHDPNTSRTGHAASATADELASIERALANDEAPRRPRATSDLREASNGDVKTFVRAPDPRRNTTSDRPYTRCMAEACRGVRLLELHQRIECALCVTVVV